MKCSSQRREDLRLCVNSLIFAQAIGDNNKRTVLEVETSRMEPLERFEDEVRELSINRLVENTAIVIDGKLNELACSRNR